MFNILIFDTLICTHVIRNSIICDILSTCGELFIYQKQTDSLILNMNSSDILKDSDTAKTEERASIDASDLGDKDPSSQIA